MEKKDSDKDFDVTVGSYEGAEICELVGLYIMDKLDEKYGKKNNRLMQRWQLSLLWVYQRSRGGKNKESIY